jgi:hypothetical protein
LSSFRVAISRSAKHSAVRFGACAHDRSRRLECQADREIAVSGTCLGSEQSKATDRSSVPKSWPELRIRKTAAQTRIVSGGGFWPIRRELSRHFKYMARGRIPEFESYHPSHAVVSSAVITGIERRSCHLPSHRGSELAVDREALALDPKGLGAPALMRPRKAPTLGQQSSCDSAEAGKGEADFGRR